MLQVSKIELLMLVSDFMVIQLKLLNGILMEFTECLKKDVNKKGHFLHMRSRAILIATGVNFLDTKYEFYRFNDDLRGTIN